MKQPERLLALIREIMQGYEKWESHLPKLDEVRLGGMKRWRIYCGDGRYDDASRNAAFSRKTGVALNFQIGGTGDDIDRYEICVAWPDAWRLMFHLDPKQEAWPGHPRYHIQIEAPKDPANLPSFLAWRLPFAEAQPERLLEYLVTHVA